MRGYRYFLQIAYLANVVNISFVFPGNFYIQCERLKKCSRNNYLGPLWESSIVPPVDITFWRTDFTWVHKILRYSGAKNPQMITWSSQENKNWRWLLWISMLWKAVYLCWGCNTSYTYHCYYILGGESVKPSVRHVQVLLSGKKQHLKPHTPKNPPPKKTHWTLIEEEEDTHPVF